MATSNAQVLEGLCPKNSLRSANNLLHGSHGVLHIPRAKIINVNVAGCVLGKNSISDRQLVDLAKQGDEAALAKLMGRHYTKALRVALGLAKNQNDAEDIVQDAFVRVVTQIKKFEGQSAFYTWLYRIVVNLSLDFLRRRRRETCEEELADASESSHKPPPLWPTCDDADPDVSCERSEMRNLISRAYNRLPDIHQAVLLLRDVEGMSYEEMAAVLNVRKGTVMSRLFHARKAMQESLRPVFSRPATAKEQA